MFKLILHGLAILDGPVYLRSEVHQGQALRPCFLGNPDCILWIEVRPVRAAVPGL